MTCLLQQLAPARGIIDRIRTRDLYKIVDFKLVPSVCKEAWKSALTVRHIVEEAAAHRKQLVLRGESPSDVPVVHEEDVIVDWSSLHMGMKDKNPMKLVRFYGKHKLNGVYSIPLSSVMITHTVHLCLKSPSLPVLTKALT